MGGSSVPFRCCLADESWKGEGTRVTQSLSTLLTEASPLRLRDSTSAVDTFSEKGAADGPGSAVSSESSTVSECVGMIEVAESKRRGCRIELLASLSTSLELELANKSGEGHEAALFGSGALRGVCKGVLQFSASACSKMLVSCSGSLGASGALGMKDVVLECGVRTAFEDSERDLTTALFGL